jgi:uncharacterized protein Usg
MKSIELMLRDYRLTTAEILYHFPDFPSLLQTYVWQDYDQSPEFPELKRFLNFWERSIEGRLHSVKVAKVELIKPSELVVAKGEFYLQ